MVDAIMLRTGPHETLVELDRHAGVPVINGLTYEHHPCQALADAQTLRERFGDLAGLRVAYLGDGNNVCVSLMVVGRPHRHGVTAACPEGFTPDPRVRRLGRRAARGQRRLGARGARPGRGGRRAPAPSTPTPGSRWATRAARPSAARPSRRTASTTRCSDGRARRRGPALPARPPRRGDHLRGAPRAALGRLGPGREPDARPGRAARPHARRSLARDRGGRRMIPLKDVNPTRRPAVLTIGTDRRLHARVRVPVDEARRRHRCQPTRASSASTASWPTT